MAGAGRHAFDRNALLKHDSSDRLGSGHHDCLPLPSLQRSQLKQLVARNGKAGENNLSCAAVRKRAKQQAQR